MVGQLCHRLKQDIVYDESPAFKPPRRGGRWREHREVIDAIAWKFQTGSQWVHLPEKYRNWRGVYNRLRIWAIDSTWERVSTALIAQADAEEDLNWAVSLRVP
ncbi:transposase [Streptomyces sp. AHU1]|uniref:transposase n=1 Tax=Streptomyces sp. AHU1 TaxID=3377215 RepID=UPI0038783B6C